MLKVGIIGATGYAGEKLISILLEHPKARITNLSAKIERPLPISQIFAQFKNKIDLVCTGPDLKKITAGCELVFLALPHTLSMELVPKLLTAGLRVIDLSADYRLKDSCIYEQFYKIKHKDKHNLKAAVYGLPEIYRKKIKSAKLIANPGCYPTAAILGIMPSIVADLIVPDYILIDAKSGVTGAGRTFSEKFLFSEVNENFRAYKINVHQHMPEINQELTNLSKSKIAVNFVPHLLPLNCGILETIYLRGKPGVKLESKKIIDLYKRFYKKEPFVRILEDGKFPELKDVVGTNFCDIGIYADEKKGMAIIVVCIDNLLKGAAGQAVQNMNIMYNFPEGEAIN